jgi:putative ABC transport system ATP-binding protein
MKLWKTTISKEEQAGRVRQVLKDVGLLEKKDLLPHQLSGGQNQRVAIARALVNNPTLILADEPTGNLDTKTGEIILETLERLHSEQGRTIIIITHEPYVALRAERIINIRDGEIVTDNKNHRRLIENNHTS